jgi:hypothetical protein
MKSIINGITALVLVASSAFAQNQIVDNRQPGRDLPKAENGVPAEMYIFEAGGHGFALLENRGPVISWTQRCIDWMKLRGIVSVR